MGSSGFGQAIMRQVVEKVSNGPCRRWEKERHAFRGFGGGRRSPLSSWEGVVVCWEKLTHLKDAKKLSLDSGAKQGLLSMCFASPFQCKSFMSSKEVGSCGSKYFILQSRDAILTKRISFRSN